MTHNHATTKPQAQPIGDALEQALARLRRGNPRRAVTIVVPTGPNSVFVRTALGLQAASLGVWCETPEGIIRGQAPLSTWASRVDEPAGWLRPTLRRLVRELGERGALGEAGSTLGRHAWLDPLARALRHLEEHGASPAMLLDIEGDDREPEEVRRQARLLAALLSGLAEAREAAALLSSADVTTAATKAAQADESGVGAAAARAVIVVGDRALPALTWVFFSTWLKHREVIEVRLPGLAPAASSSPLSSSSSSSSSASSVLVGPAPLGLRAAIRAAHPHLPPEAIVSVAPASSSGLASLQGADVVGTAAWPLADVEIARTPDDVRECHECVREVQRSIRAGVPLDRIAVVLPDGAQRPALEDALRRAAIPATWLIGFPLRELLPARLLTLALRLARTPTAPAPGPRVDEVYALLLHPGLALRAALGPDATAARGRWRRIVSKLVGVEGLSRLRARLQRLPMPALEPVALEREVRARASLQTSLRALDDSLLALAEPATLNGHAARWIAWLLRFARAGEPRDRLVRALGPLSSSTTAGPLAGPLLTLEEARLEWESLQAQEIARGSLTERSIRVLSPLHLIGGSFDVVCALGLSEGRFPTATRPDPLVSDALMSSLGKRLGVALPTSLDHAEAERRRMAALIGACRRRLWLSCPRYDFARERPVLPSTLVLAVLSVHLGRRALFDDVERVAVSRGRRARSFPDDPDDALDRREHLLARAALLRVAPLPSAMSSVSAATTTPAMTLSALLSLSSSRGLLHLARSIDRAARGEPLDAYTGFLPPTLLPMAGLDGAPIPVWIVAELLTDPAKVLFRRLLGATPAPWLVPRVSPLDRRAIEDTELALSRQLTLPPGGTEQQARDALTTQLRQALADAHGVDDVDDPALAHAIALAVRHAAERAALTRAFWQEPPLHDEVVPLGHAWPWQLTSLPGRRLVLGEGDAARQTLVGLVDTVEPRAFARKETALALSALALHNAGRGCEAIAVLDRAKRSPAVTLDQVEAIWAPALSRATAAAQAGLWSLSGSSFGLAAERGRDDDDDAAAATTGTPS